jgi:diguanylate cyclase (GGDEF)-like protein
MSNSANPHQPSHSAASLLPAPAYPTPINEEQRVKAVQALLTLFQPGQAPEPATPSNGAYPEAAAPTLPALARVAARSTGAAVALIGLLDADSLQVLASVGLELPELHRQVAVCAHTIAQPGKPTVVEDLACDPRFAHSPLLQQTPPLRFYAGAAIVDGRGHALGTVAVMDTQPRRLSASECAALCANLSDLASLALTTLAHRQQADQLAHQALHDQLTGLSNRAHFKHTLDVELAHAMRTGEPFTVLCMDLDGFKAVNDGFGHAAGDEVLCEVSRRLTQQVRLGDVLARFSGDEFGVVMRHGAKDSAQVLAKRIVKSVSAPITLSSGDTIGVGISVGMAAYSDDVDAVSTLLAQADQALYQAKKQNEKRWKMFVGIR